MIRMLTGNPWALAAAAVAVFSLGAASGWKVENWRMGNQVKAVQMELSDYQRQAAEIIAARLRENAQLEAANRNIAAEVDAQFLKGKTHAEKSFQPIRDELALMRRMWSVRDGAPDVPAGGLPGGPDTAGVSEGGACTDQPGRIIAAADRVIKDLEACGNIARQLSACRTYALTLKCSAPTTVSR